MTPLVFRSHRARPVWVSKAHTTPPDVPSGSHCSQAPRQGNVSISFPALWATSSHWPLVNLFFWATHPPDRGGAHHHPAEHSAALRSLARAAARAPHRGMRPRRAGQGAPAARPGGGGPERP